jgi:uncharacterized membrane protein
MSWTLIIALAVGAYAFKFTGLVIIGGRTLPAPLERSLALIPAAVISALIIKDTLTQGQDIVIDARAAGIAVAIVAAWRRAPLIAVIIAGAATTALLRQIS